MASGYKFNYTGPIVGATLSYGELWMWGANGSGQLGDNTAVSRSSPVQTIAGGTDWSSISTGDGSSAAIKIDGTLWTWGQNNRGQLGDNTVVNKSSPIQTVTGGSTWSSVSVGSLFMAGIKTDGTLWMWGYNAAGQLGDGTITFRSSPVQTIAGGSNWSSVSCGYNHTAAIKTDGTLWTWGSNGGTNIGQGGQLGDNSSWTNKRSSPVQTVAGGSTWSKVNAGYTLTGAIKTDGTLWMWGDNAYGELGVGDLGYPYGDVSSPIQTITRGTNWSQVSNSYRTVVATKTDGTLWVWGRGTSGSIGNNAALNRSSPIQTGLNSNYWQTAWAGAESVRALKNDGTLWAWGKSNGGNIGDGAASNRSNPTQVVGSIKFKGVSNGGGGSPFIGTSVHSGAIGNSFTSALVDLSDVYQEKYYFPSNTGGYLWLTGGGPSFFLYGQLGNNNTNPRSSPVQTVAGGSTWKQVSVGYLQSAAIKTDGTLWTWGRNSNGQLGDNTTVDKSSPVQTITGGSWSAVSCGYEFITAIKPDGTLWTWGRNNNGQLGDNTTVDKSSPVQTIAGGTNWSSMATGRFTAAAIKTDGTLWLWGAGLYGKLGDNTSDAKSSPVQTVAGGTNWLQVSTSAQFNTSAVKTDGTLWSWGYNGFGALGDNTTVDKSSPVQTITGGTNWSQVSCGLHYSAAVKSDGTLWAWGANTGGKLGDNTVVGKSSPVQTITRGTNWKQVSCFYHTAAIQYNGTLWVWGDNTSGKLGDNTITNRSSPVQTIMRGQTWRQVSCGYSVTAAISDY